MGEAAARREESALLAACARSFFADRAPLRHLGDAERDGRIERDRWRALGELGWLGVSNPSEPGALAVHAAALVAEAGRVLFPDPLVGVLAVARALGVAGDPHSLLAEVTAGSRIIAPVLTGAGGRVEVSSRGRLSGSVAFVESPDGADAFVVLGSTDESFLVDAEDPGAAVRPMRAMVGGAWSELVLTRAAAIRIPVPGLVETGAALAATFAAAAAGALLEATVAYVAGRRQFGRPIGSFQAVQHSLASSAIAVDQSRALARRALAAVEGEDLPAARYASALAFVAATDRFVDVARRCHQVWGGMGFSTESDVHHFSRRARWMKQTWGGRTRHLDAVANERLRTKLLLDRYAEARALS